MVLLYVLPQSEIVVSTSFFHIALLEDVGEVVSKVALAVVVPLDNLGAILNTYKVHIEHALNET